MREMKDSGIAWIGEIPKEWEVAKTKLFGKIKSGDGISNSELEDSGLYQVWGGGVGVLGYSNLFNAEANSIVIGRVGACGYVKQSQERVFVSDNALIMSVNQEYDSRFFYYIMIAADLSTLNTSTAQPLITATKIGNVYIPYFSIIEQRLIANFLDKKCGEIDELVALQEKMIEELKAYKQSVITETVTKGLDPNVKMKDSGVDWIGEIPEGWSVTKIKLMAETTSGSTPRTISNSSKANIKWFRTTDINENIVSDSPIHLTDSEYQSASCPMLEPNTCLVAMYGGGGTIGKFGMLSERATINQALCSITPLPFMDSKYIFHILKAIRTYWMKYANGTRKDPNINQEIVRNMLIVVPPLSEQRSIATYLDEKCSEIDSLIAIKQKKIEELKDYKKSLIYEYVTGKKQVG